MGAMRTIKYLVVENVLDDVPDNALEIDVEVSSPDDVASELLRITHLPASADIYLQTQRPDGSTRWQPLTAVNALPEGGLLLAKLAKPKAAGSLSLLTERQYIGQTLPMLRSRTSDRASNSRTRPSNPRTWSSLVQWPDFMASAQQVYEDLDDTTPCFPPMVVANAEECEDGTVMFGQPAASEEDVKALLNLVVLQGVTQVAKAKNLGVEYTGTGSGRQLSKTDLLLRECGTSQRDALSRLILGIIEVKGDWQLKLTENDDLISAFHDPARTVMVTEITQQVYGDAVQDEAPLIIISNYKVTYFLLREVQDVRKKQLLVSPAVPWNSQDPPAMACWLFALTKAAQLRDANVKATLSRDKVPGTPSDGYVLAIGDRTLQLHSRSFRNGVAVLGARHSASAEQEQQQQQQEREESLVGTTHCTVLASGYSSRGGSDAGSRPSSDTLSVLLSSSSSMDSNMQGPETSGAAIDWQRWADAAQQPGSAAAVTAINALPWLPSSLLQYTDAAISCSDASTVVKGVINDVAGCVEVAVKVYGSTPEALQLFLAEAVAYIRLAELQGSSIVPLLALGRLPHSGQPVLVLALGQRLPWPVTQELAATARRALASLHDLGFSHGDVRSSNLLVYEGKVVLCDLQTCMPGTAQGIRQQELAELQQVLGDHQ